MLDIALTHRFEGSLAGVIFKVSVDQSPHQTLRQSINPASHSIAPSFVILDLVDSLPTCRLSNHRQISRFCLSQPIGQVYPALLSGALESTRWLKRLAVRATQGALSEQIPRTPHIGAHFVCRLSSFIAPAQTALGDLANQDDQSGCCPRWGQLVGLLRIDRLGYLPHQLVSAPPYGLVSIQPQQAPYVQRRVSNRTRQPTQKPSPRINLEALKVDQQQVPRITRRASGRSRSHSRSRSRIHTINHFLHQSFTTSQLTQDIS